MSEPRPLTSASNISRRETCPGSAFAEHGLPNGESEAASEGTMLHAHMADPNLDKTPLTPEQQKTLEIARHSDLEIFKVVEASAAARGPVDDYEEQKEIELWLRRGIKPAFGGHTDLARYYRHAKMLVIVDYKFGRVRVDEAESNLQLRAYACMGADKWDCDHVLVAINQPRLPADQRLTVAEYTRDALRQAKAQLLAIYDTAHNKDGTPREDAPRKAGESQCRYCRAQLQCTAYQKTFSFLAADAPMGKDAFVAERIATMDDSDLDRVYTACKFAALVQDKAKEEIIRRIELGSMKAWQVVPGRKTSEITDRPRAFRLLQPLMPVESVLGCSKISLPDLADELRRREGITVKAAKEKIFSALQPVIEVTESAPSLKRVESGQPELLP